eukprot:2795972-Prymnesium_polylepis.1
MQPEITAKSKGDYSLATVSPCNALALTRSFQDPIRVGDLALPMCYLVVKLCGHRNVFWLFVDVLSA